MSEALSLPNPTDFAVAGFILLIVIEMIYGWKTGRARFEGKDTVTSMIMGLGSTISGALFGGIFYLIAYFIWENYRIFDFGHGIEIFALAFALDDFRYYWAHRFGHRIRWMWAAHVVHHSSQHYNLSTALRQTWTSFATPGFLLAWPIFFLGIEPALVFFAYGFNLIYQFWIHTEAINKMPRWFEAVMNTPSHHRVHHANNPKYLDSNYAGVFIIWDKMFGTFIPEDEEKPIYGLVYNLSSFNPLKVAVHEWVGIGRDWMAASSWSHRIQYLLKPPGWTPDGSRKTSDMLKEEWRVRRDAD